MIVSFYPLKHKGNSYINQMLRSYDAACGGARYIDTSSLQGILKHPVNFLRCRFFILNWYETIYGSRRVSKYFLKTLFIIILTLAGKKIVWVMHNKSSHAVAKDKYSEKLTRRLIKSAFKIVIHCRESAEILKGYGFDVGIESKFVLVPHPLYDVEVDLTPVPDKGQFNMLFAGAVSPYKNIELLLNVMDSVKDMNISLTVAGRPSSKEYSKMISDKVQHHQNIVYIPRFMDDTELQQLIVANDIMVLPYDKRSSLNSGSMILAFSCARTVIAPIIGTMRELENRASVFEYDYNDLSTHSDALRDAIIRAYSSSREDVRERGNVLRNEMLSNNSLEVVSKALRPIFVQ